MLQTVHVIYLIVAHVETAVQTGLDGANPARLFEFLVS